MNYELILLDADGTLFDYDMAEANALEKAFNYFNIKYVEEVELEKYRMINKQIWADYENDKIGFEDLRIERFRRLFQNDEEKVDYNEFSKIYLSLLAGGTYLKDGAEEVCKYLFTKYKIAILTNGFKDVQISRIENSPLNKYIHQIIVSEETGYKKPDIGIFNYAFNKIGHANKGTTLIVGDSLTSDIQGGINYKISTCWYNSIGEENKTGLKPDYEIKDLKELFKLL
ncbi:YjjG family noncanonical pyrimidine nucleotidase [Clostridium akagii]|uniref:YjjG family noncanonical pyrimidine nucleotidase n=1 Tax=Clostridium akagii TaxID=91623 RepID=UPI00047A657B|nr:YjjG family noncanonical pyrimidine nucleotidase [Clostridium akagii]